MIEIINLQKLLGNIYNGNISLAAKLNKYRYLRKEDFRSEVSLCHDKDALSYYNITFSCPKHKESTNNH